MDIQTQNLNLFDSDEPAPPQIDGLEYTPDFISANEESALLAQIDKQPWLPAHGKNLLKMLLSSQNKELKMLGCWLAFGASYYHTDYLDLHDELINQSIEHKRIAADVAADLVDSSEFHDLAQSRIQTFFNDNDEHVRQNASHVFQHIRTDEIGRYKEIIEAYIQSQAFDGDTFDFLRLLKETTQNVSGYAIQSAKKIVEHSIQAENTANKNMRDFTYINDILEKEYTLSEYNPDLRKQYLDIIDQMLELEIYGIDKVIQNHERHH